MQNVTSKTKLKFYKSDILRILNLIYDRSEKRMSIDWKQECAPFNVDKHGLVLFRFLSMFNYVKRESSATFEYYNWISKESPKEAYQEISNLLLDFEDKLDIAKDIIECVGEFRPDVDSTKNVKTSSRDQILSYARGKMEGFYYKDLKIDLNVDDNISGMLSVMTVKEHLLYKLDRGFYILPEYLKGDVKLKMAANKTCITSIQQEILDQMGVEPMSLKTLSTKIRHINSANLHSRLATMIKNGLLESPQRGHYKLKNNLDFKNLQNIATPDQPKTLYTIEYEACCNKLNRLKLDQIEAKNKLNLIQTELDKTQIVHDAIHSILNNLETLKSLGIAVMS